MEFKSIKMLWWANVFCNCKSTLSFMIGNFLLEPRFSRAPKTFWTNVSTVNDIKQKVTLLYSIRFLTVYCRSVSVFHIINSDIVLYSQRIIHVTKILSEKKKLQVIYISRRNLYTKCQVSRGIKKHNVRTNK